MARAWRTPRIYTLLDAAVDGARVEDFGHRAGPLADAQRRGVPVADTWFLPVSVFRDAVEVELPPGHDPGSLIRTVHKSSGLERAARARERLLSLTFPDVVREELGRFFAEHGRRGWGLTLRASPTLADATIAEDAGLEQVSHGISSYEGFERGILRLWALAVEEQTLTRLRGRRVKDLAMAIAIQRLEPLRASCLALGHDGAPHYDPSHRPASTGTAFLLATTYGLGSPVSDGASPRNFVRIASDGSVLARKIAHKSGAIAVVEGERRVVPVDPVDADRPAFDDAALARVAEAMRKLDNPSSEAEVQLTCDGNVWVTDIRRGVGDGSPLGGSASSVWSRTGIADLLPGVPTPLSASLVQEFVDSALRKTIEALGARLPKETELVSRARGRHYLNVSALIPALSGVPGIEPSVLVGLLRGGDPAAIARALAVAPHRGSLMALSVAATRLFIQEKRLTDALARFEREAEQRRRWLSEMDLAILPDDALVTTLKETHGVVASTGKLLLESSVVALAAHLAFQSAVGRVVPDGSARLAQALSAGVVELESARPAVALAHVVEILRSDSPAMEALGSAQSPRDLPAGAGRRAFESWLEAFGERGHAELEIQSPRWGEDLAPVLAMLRAGLRAPPADPEQRLSRVRAAADRELAQLESAATSLEMVLIRNLLGRAHGLARLRERMRVWMAKVTAMTRRVVLDVDRRLGRLDATLEPGSAFFLTEHELISATGRTRADLGALVRMRRDSFERDAGAVDPPDTFVGAPPRVVAPAFDARGLRGAPASGGVVTGRVRLLGQHATDADALEPGEIIVVRTPDVGYAPLLFWAGGLISDSGSALSHIAVVARELGAPAVLGTLDASTTLRGGEMVRVDGDLGTVERIDG